MELTCQRCGELWWASRYQSVCWNCRGKERYERNRAAYAAWKEQGCRICGELDPDYIDAHHVQPTILYQKPGRYRGIRYGVPCGTFLKELDRCIPLCVRCHRKVTLGKIVVDATLST